MFVTLADHQHVAGQVLVQHVPRLVTGILQAANAKALALADGVVHQAMVAADHFTFGGFDVARLGWQVLLEEVAEAALANEADAGGIFFLGGGQAVFFGDGAHCRFFQLTDREQGAGNFLAADGVQEVALVLVRVQALEQFGERASVTTAHVVAGGDQVGTQ